MPSAGQTQIADDVTFPSHHSQNCKWFFESFIHFTWTFTLKVLYISLEHSLVCHNWSEDHQSLNYLDKNLETEKREKMKPFWKSPPKPVSASDPLVFLPPARYLKFGFLIKADESGWKWMNVDINLDERRKKWKRKIVD